MVSLLSKGVYYFSGHILHAVCWNQHVGKSQVCLPEALVTGILKTSCGVLTCPRRMDWRGKVSAGSTKKREGSFSSSDQLK